MRIRFDGKTAVVSGVGHGFGRCIAETFAHIGARVVGCDLSAAELAETAKTGVDIQVLDLTDRAEILVTFLQKNGTLRRLRAKPCKKIVDIQAARPSSWKTPCRATCMAR